MSKHVAPEIQFPAQRAIRSALGVVASGIVLIASIIGVGAVLFPQLLAAVADVLPPEWVAWASGALVTLAAVSAAVSRIMAIPLVNDFLTKFGAGSVPKSVVDVKDNPPKSIPQTEEERQAFADEQARLGREGTP